jgi:hypothetical protein
VAQCQQPDGRRCGNRHDDRDEHRRQLVGESLDARRLTLDIPQQGDDPVERAVGVLAGPDRQRLIGDDRAAADLVARPLRSRDRLAGDERLVDRGHAVDDLAVDRNPLARPDQQLVARLDIADWDRRAVGPRGFLDLRCGEFREPFRRLLFDLGLVVVPGCDDEDDRHRHVEVELGATEEQRQRTVEIRADRRDRDQQIHIRLAGSEADVGPSQDRIPGVAEDERVQQPELAEEIQAAEPAQLQQRLEPEVGWIQKQQIPHHRHHPEEPAADEKPDHLVVVVAIVVERLFGGGVPVPRDDTG